MPRPAPQPPASLLLALTFAAIGLAPAGEAPAEENLTPNVPIEEFQNRGDTAPSYNFDAPPQGLFRTIQFAEGFEEEVGFRRSHEIIPVTPTNVFGPKTAAVYVVFNVHPHLESFQVFGRCYAEQVAGLDPKEIVAEDTMYLALEDESGYVKLPAPSGGWKPGTYKVEIHVGWKVNELSLVGTMRFTVAPPRPTTAKPPVPLTRQ